MIEQHPIADRASWLELRKQDVTASAVGALLGVHPYMTAYGLWAEKTGRVEGDLDENPAMRRGRLLEPVAVLMLREERPDWRVEAPGTYYRDPAARLGATPDAIAWDEDSRRGVVQIKTVEAGIFRRKWRDPETGGIDPPLWIAIQAITEAHLVGAEWAAVAAMVVSHGIDLQIIEVPLHEGVIGKIRGAVRDFWEMVESGRTPEPDWKRDGALIERLFHQDNGTEIDLSADNMLPALVAERATLSEQKGAAEKRLKEIKAEILGKMGEAAAARLADGRVITAKTVHKKPYSVAATSYRDVRVRAGAPA